MLGVGSSSSWALDGYGGPTFGRRRCLGSGHRVPGRLTAMGDQPLVWTVIVAAGSGTRFGRAKQYLELAGVRVVDHSVATAARVSEGVVVVVPPPDVSAESSRSAATVVVAGGPSRAASVRNGLAAVPEEAAIICVHDAARPLAGTDVYRRVIDEVRAGADGAVPVVPVTDTIRRVDGGVVDRSTLQAVQTPQAFRAELLRMAHAGAGEATDGTDLVAAAGCPTDGTDLVAAAGCPTDDAGLVQAAGCPTDDAGLVQAAGCPTDDAGLVQAAGCPTDDAGLVEAAGHEVVAVEGHPGNIKITHPHDLVAAEAWLAT